MKRTQFSWILIGAMILAGLSVSAAPGAQPGDKATAVASPAKSPAKSPARPRSGRPSRYTPGTESKNHRTMMHAFRDVVAAASNSTVRVLGDGKQVALGAVVRADGYVLTKASELTGRLQVALPGGTHLAAIVVGTDKTNDLALLKVGAESMAVVPWSDGKPLTVGSWMATPGVAVDPVAVGIVSVATRPGGRLLVTPVHGFLGVSLESIDRGARVVQVIPRSAAASAKLLKEDVIIKVDTIEVSSREDLTGYLHKTKPGQKVTLKLRRKGKHITLPITLGKWAGASQSDRMNRMGGALSERRTGFSRILQHDGPLAPNQCGGPVVDVAGKVVGINIARAGRIESHALPVEVVKPLLNKMVAAAETKAKQADPAIGEVTAADLAKLYANLAKLDAEAASYLELKGKVKATSAEIEKALERTRIERETLQKALLKARRTLEAINAK